MRILILIPNLDNIGGVGNFYKVLKLTDIKGIDYFEIGRSPNESIFRTFLRLPYNYLRFIYLIIKNVDIWNWSLAPIIDCNNQHSIPPIITMFA